MAAISASTPELSCARCGYSLHGLSEPVCPECGAVTDPAALGRRGSWPVAAALGFLLGAIVQVPAVLLSGGGHGDYVPLLLVAGPALLVPAGVFFGGPVLFALYGAVLAIARRRRWGGRALLAVAAAHCGFIALTVWRLGDALSISTAPAEWLAGWRAHPVATTSLVVLLLAGAALAASFALGWRRR